ncbi:hypothetical protein [Spiroplasma floricola]|uniref:Transmembrane protein n=1 Tax=Spiroplasma floricola 23-6 TaxID=1336749 RepID=A0A2K8SE11_9MOLU|nr:hypothetical protein [Spiroplasma floricola]AUB31663.1 hypothetical protein SFLOR_v1c06130 [Spiroplasma floricola 23-6]
MEAKKIYQDSIFLLANLIKNEQLRVELLNNSEFKKQTIELINDLLVLEINENCTFKDQKWSPVFGKALVNITKEKLKFIKPEDKKADDVLSDITYIQTYLFNNLQISRDSLTDQNFELTEDLVKENSKITDEMKEKYLKVSEKPEPEVVDKSKEQPNTNTNQQSGFQGFAGVAGAGGNAGQGNPFMGSGLNTIPPTPLQDMRFYPYSTKPKYTKWLKLTLGIVLGLSVVFFILISIVFQLVSSFKITNDLNGLSGFDKEFAQAWSAYLEKRKSTQYSWYLSNSLGIQSGPFSIVILVILGLMMGWIIFTIVQPPKTYRQQFTIPGINLVVPAMFLIMMIFTCSRAIGYIFGANVPFSSLSGFLAVVTNNKSMTTESFNNWINANKSGLDQLVTAMNNHFDMTMAKILIWFFFISVLMAGITIIIILFLNPRLDREKIAKANDEYQMMISELMQGRSYEIDPNLYEPQEEIDAFLKSLEDRQNKNKDKDDEKK